MSSNTKMGNRNTENLIMILSSLGPKPLVLNPLRPNPKPVQPSSKPQSVPMGLGLTLNLVGYHHPPPPSTTLHPITEGRVPHKIQRVGKNGPPYVKKISTTRLKAASRLPFLSADTVSLSCCQPLFYFNLSVH